MSSTCSRETSAFILDLLKSDPLFANDKTIYMDMSLQTDIGYITKLICLYRGVIEQELCHESMNEIVNSLFEDFKSLIGKQFHTAFNQRKLSVSSHTFSEFNSILLKSTNFDQDRHSIFPLFLSIGRRYGYSFHSCGGGREQCLSFSCAPL